jgi:drug/metabolite transporter (DMT)-like permease
MPAPPPHWRLALLLALLTAALWGVLPIALRIVMHGMDPITVTWYRFGTAAVLLGLYLAFTGGLPRLLHEPWAVRILLLAAALGLTANYVLFVVGVKLTTPATTVTVNQLANVFLLLGGLVLFHERFSKLQWSGLLILLAGQLLFFNHRLPLLFTSDAHTGWGVALVTVGSLCWSGYGLAQKQLLKRLSSAQVLWLLYVAGMLMLWPWAHPSQLATLAAGERGALLFCALNTLIAYGAFAEAMKLWQVTRVTALVATTPLFTLLAALIAGHWLHLASASEPLNALAVSGAIAVVAGSALCALGSRRPAPTASSP